MKGKLLAFAFAVFGVATIGMSQLVVKADGIDGSRDCDQYAVVYCGTMSVTEARNKYNEKDHAKIFQSMGISQGEISGDIRDGVVYQDGRVVVNGKTVATGAMMAARNLGGSPIAGTGAAKVSVSKMGSAQTAMVKFDQNGRFMFAIMKPCGNPVTATPPPAPKPEAQCKGLTQEKISDNRYRYQATAAVSGGATVRSYTFETTRNGQQVDRQNVNSDRLTAGYTFTAKEAGNYRVRVTVNTSEGAKTGPNCVKEFSVKNDKPGVGIEKYVDKDQKYKRVGVNVEYSYRIIVTNTGNTDLKNVKVSDTPQQGITLISVNPPKGKVTPTSWNYTIPNLMKGEKQVYTLTAKVPVYLAGMLKNTVCVDAPEVPGNPDECDSADVDVPPEGSTQVCNPATGETITVKEEEASQYVPVGSPECTPATPTTPEELPQTGPAETILSIIGAMSLAGSGAYYLNSRRHI